MKIESYKAATPIISRGSPCACEESTERRMTMNEETKKYIEDLREKFEGECNGSSDLKRRQELLTTARHAITISDEDFTKVETEYAVFEANSSFEFGFYVGARWADKHPQSPGISVKDRLPQSEHSVLIALADGTYSTGSLFGDKIDGKNYWDVDRGDDFVEVNDNDYWMPIPKLNKSENQ